MTKQGLLNGVGLCERLGISTSLYRSQKALGRLKCFEVARPLGTFKYSAQLVEDYLAGRPVSQFGRRRAS